MNALVYVDIDRGIHKGKLKNALNEKQKKLRGFSFSINMANFEAFRRTKKMISNVFFLKSALELQIPPLSDVTGLKFPYFGRDRPNFFGPWNRLGFLMLDFGRALRPFPKI